MRSRPVATPVLAAILAGVSGEAGCAAHTVAELSFEQHGFAFERYEVVTGSAQRQTVLTGFLLGGDVADMAVVTMNDDGERRLEIRTSDSETWTPRLDATLRPGVSFVDVLNIAGHDRLVTYEPGRLNWFDPASTSERPLLAVTSNFAPPREGQIHHVDITRDVNDDGRDDLVVPDVDGFQVFVQTADGAFADGVTIGPPADMAGIYGADGYRYDPWRESRIHAIDYDRDGRSDLAFWNRGRFEVHRQRAHGLFAPSAETFTTAVELDADGISSLATGDMTGTVLHALADANADAVADLVTYSLQGRRVSRKRSTFGVHFGTPAPGGGIAFAPDADTAIRSDRGIQLGMVRHDFDRDGRVDVMITAIHNKYLQSNLWRRFSGFMGGDIWLDLEFYRMDGGRYPGEPDATRRIQLHDTGSIREPGWVPLDVALRGGLHENRRWEKRHRGTFNSTLLIGDVTGDGRSDLLIEITPDHFHLFVGAPGPNLFAGEPLQVSVPVPQDEEYTWLVDMNRDGKQDVLLHHASVTEPHRVTLLIAR